MFDLAWLLSAPSGSRGTDQPVCRPPNEKHGSSADRQRCRRPVLCASVWCSLATVAAAGRRTRDHRRALGLDHHRRLQRRRHLLLDPLSLTMVLVVTGVGTLIHLYSISYMADDERFQRYFVYLNFFILAMLILVLSDNFLGMFVGWEGVGLASFLLIGFWFDRRDDTYGYYADAGKKAFLVNRVGDFGLIVAMALIWTSLARSTFLDMGDAVHHRRIAVGSGQHHLPAAAAWAPPARARRFRSIVWLPDAMAGPTPVSALIHAATMVTAGIYMIARTNALWHDAASCSMTAAWIGVLTAFFAATIALVQTDLKKILAYSTISQLGYMMVSVGVGAYGAAIFHLTTHAFFKALLFLGAGSVMHATHGELDIRKMGGLRHKMPITYWTFLIGVAALAGIPPLAGFFSKDAILLGALVEAPLLYILGLAHSVPDGSLQLPHALPGLFGQAA